MIGIYNLLCDDCNLLFTGFAIPGTVSNRTKKRKETESKSKRLFENCFQPRSGIEKVARRETSGTSQQ
jgi:hypothetical protein